MNLRLLLVSASVLWLAGCATAPSTTTPYDGPLKPITPASVATSKVASLEYNNDLWERIRRGFAMPELKHELVDSQEQWYGSRPDYIARMTTRSSKYLFHIVEELEQRNMPMELALLPYIESAFNPQAVSSARAVGMWQFMPATGSDFDLTQNIFRDDRRDVLASTRAALDYLEKLHRMFGDWHLALAAYNWGQGSVSRAIKHNERQGLGTSYTDLSMPNETRNYVPKLQAVKNIIATPEKFDIELPHIENHPYFQAVEIKRDMDIELVARLADVRVEDFKALNPSFNRPTIFARGTPHVLLPWDNAKVFQRNLAAHDDGKLASWTVWVAPSTMTVASAAQRTGMSESELRSANRIPAGMMVKAGSALMVPRTAQHNKDVATHIANNGSIAFTPEMVEVTRRTTVKVLRGDTMAKVARRHGVTVADLARWNNIKANAPLRAGQSLQVQKTVRVSAAAAQRPAANARNTGTARGTRTTNNARATRAAPAKNTAQPRKSGTPTKKGR